MDDHKQFKENCKTEIYSQGQDSGLKEATTEWFNKATEYKYSYHFEWLGRPIIQFPQDIIATQQLIWSTKPDLIIETGIARGGSLIFYASILELIAQCGGNIDAKVIGVDIDIRQHNKDEILRHPMSKRIEMIQGSSIDKLVYEKVIDKAKTAKRIMVCLDSNHTHSHVLDELRLYAPLVSLDSYLVVFDTIIEDLPSNLIGDRPWSKGNNPKTAIFQYLKEIEENKIQGQDGSDLKFQIDQEIDNQLLISVSPSGYLKRSS